MQQVNHYEILELEPTCTKEDIKKAYKSLSKKYHPDTNNGETLDKFLAIREAYDILYNEESRYAYDSGIQTIKPHTKNELYSQLAFLFEKMVEDYILSPDLDYINLQKGMKEVISRHLGEVQAERDTIDAKITNLKKLAKRIKRTDGDSNLFEQVLNDKVRMLEQIVLMNKHKNNLLTEALDEVNMYEMETFIRTWGMYSGSTYSSSSSSTSSGGLEVRFLSK